MAVTALSSRGETDIESFIEHGFVRLDDAFSRELAQQARHELWTATGLSPLRELSVDGSPQRRAAIHRARGRAPY